MSVFVTAHPAGTPMNIRSLVFPLFGILLSGGLAQAAELYQYVDETGALHFTNVPTDPQFRMIVPPAKDPVVSRSDKGKKKYTPADFEGLVADRSQRHGMDPKLVSAVIQVESEFNPKAVSKKGARGLMQLMPETARDLGVTDPFDPAQNIDGGVRYLRYLLDYFAWDLDLALAAYNAGMNRVLRHMEVPPIVETRNYVRKVKATYNRDLSQTASLRLPERRTVQKVVLTDGDVVFTNTPEAYGIY